MDLEMRKSVRFNTQNVTSQTRLEVFSTGTRPFSDPSSLG